MDRTKLPLGSSSQSGARKFHDIAISTMTQHLSFVSEFQILDPFLDKIFNLDPFDGQIFIIQVRPTIIVGPSDHF